MKILLSFLAFSIGVISCNSTEKKFTPSAPTVTPLIKTSLLGSWRLADINVTRSGSNDPLLETAGDKRILQEGLIFWESTNRS